VKGKDFLSVSDLSSRDVRLLISSAVDLKARGWTDILSGKTMALIFEKPSLRTRVSFEIAMKQLGGSSIYLSPAEVGLGQREQVSDVARVLSGYVDAICARTFSHATLETMASYASVPVINALSNVEHPCQTLADLLTIYEKKETLSGLTLSFVGDGNNVAASLVLGAALTGMNFNIASPRGYELPDKIVKQAEEYAKDNACKIRLTEDPKEAVRGVDIVYTDVWTSMGEEAEAEIRKKVFAPYQVNPDLLSLADEDVIFMHCLPAHYGEEVSTGLLDDPRSVVFEQAENRLHAQKALLAEMLGGLEIGSGRIPVARVR
jgi:ornithine carbamoyltransferase